MTSPSISELRKLLREKFPEAHGGPLAPEWDEAVDRPFDPAFFPAGALSEAVGSGLNLLLAGLLGEPEECPPEPELVLVDGGDGFDPASYPEAACSRVFWARCPTALEMMKVADMVLRDGNIPFIVMDTRGLGRRELGALPPSSWWRLKLAAEAGGCRCVVMSNEPRVPCAGLRVTVDLPLTLEDFDLPRRDLLARLKVRRDRVRRAE